MNAVFHVDEPDQTVVTEYAPGPSDRPPPILSKLPNLFQMALDNTDYRRVVETIPGQVQTVVMNIPRCGSIPDEVHDDTTQSIVVVKGSMGVAVNGKTEYGDTGAFVNIPAGSRHKVWNPSDLETLKLYTYYWPPAHPKDLVQSTFT